jgi:beta-N-acetylhexosaminidase
VPEGVSDLLKKNTPVLACLFSRTPAVATIQAEALNKMLLIRDDIIVASVGNPFDIRNFPGIDTCLLTFGHRPAQIRALFKVLLGEIQPGGKLPVEIKGLFPRWHGLNY